MFLIRKANMGRTKFYVNVVVFDNTTSHNNVN